MRQNSKGISSNVADLVETEFIPSTAAVSKELEDYENKKITFSFKMYNSSQCGIGSIDKKEAKKLTKKLKNMSAVLTKHFRHQDSSNIACKPVHNSNNYSVLFTDLSEDTDLLEVDYSGPGRIFGYLVHNIFNIVAIAKIHK